MGEVDARASSAKCTESLFQSRIDHFRCISVFSERKSKVCTILLKHFCRIVARKNEVLFLFLSTSYLSWELEEKFFGYFIGRFLQRSREFSSFILKSHVASSRISFTSQAFRIARFAQLGPSARQFCQDSYIRAERSARRATVLRFTRLPSRETVEYF